MIYDAYPTSAEGVEQIFSPDRLLFTDADRAVWGRVEVGFQAWTSEGDYGGVASALSEASVEASPTMRAMLDAKILIYAYKVAMRWDGFIGGEVETILNRSSDSQRAYDVLQKYIDEQQQAEFLAQTSMSSIVVQRVDADVEKNKTDPSMTGQLVLGTAVRLTISS